MKDAIFSLWTLSLDDKKVMPFGNVQSVEPIGSTFSPDGRWVAYAVNDTPGGVPTPNRGVYVQPFPATGVRYQVPKEYNDFHPAWGATVEQLFTFHKPLDYLLSTCRHAPLSRSARR